MRYPSQRNRQCTDRNNRLGPNRSIKIPTNGVMNMEAIKPNANMPAVAAVPAKLIQDCGIEQRKRSSGVNADRHVTNATPATTQP